MADEGEKFPAAIPDRRDLPNVPIQGRGGDRRTSPRFSTDIPVTIIVGTGENVRVLHAKARDVSNGGMFLENVDIPEDEEEISLQFVVPPGALPDGFDASFRVTGKALGRNAAQKTARVRFDEELPSILRRRNWAAFAGVSGLLMLLAVVLIGFLREESLFYFWFDVPVFLYGLCATGYLLTRVLFAAFYRPYRDSIQELPGVTIVVPCFNEAEWIDRTIRQCLDQNYPPERLSLIAVDDGSTDGSLPIMKKLQEKLERITVVQLEKNVGKRAALAVGAQMAKTDIVVFVDSDSFLAPDAIRNLVQPFGDPGIAAACGHCELENKWTNALTKMQAVRYFIGYRILKAAESVFDVVTCLSGPLAAYRREALLEVLDDWLHQTYLGYPATFGDDRSLTNYLLAHNRIVYQETAVCHTIAPSTMRQFLRQQMRWKRSWLRESLRATLFMWRKEPFVSVSFYLGLMLPVLAPLVAIRALVLLPLFTATWPVIYLLGVVSMSALLSSTYMLAWRSRLWIWGVPFCFFYLFVLMWQMPYACLTFARSNWGTRETPEPSAQGAA